MNLRTSMALGWTLTGLCLGAGIPSPVWGQVLYVDRDATDPVHDGSSWCRAFVDLQDALDVAVASPAVVSEIRVADGTYMPDRGTGDRDLSFSLRNGLALRGGYAGCGAPDPDARDFTLYETILSGDLNGDDDVRDCASYSNCCIDRIGPPLGCDNKRCEQIVCEKLPGCCNAPPGTLSLGWGEFCVEVARTFCCDEFGHKCENSAHILLAMDTDETAVLDGFTVAQGYPFPAAFAEGFGGGLFIERGGVTVTNCLFRDHVSAVSIFHGSGPAVFDHCVFRENTRTAISLLFDGQLTITNCLFEHNRGRPAVNLSGGGLTMTGTTFQYNSNGGLSISAITSPYVFRLRDCLFYRNGGSTIRPAFELAGKALLTRCRFINNIGGNASAMSTDFAVGRLANCSFIGNLGSAFSIRGSAMNLTGCVFVGNRATQGGTAIDVLDAGLWMNNCTVAHNWGQSNGSGISVTSSASLTVRNSIVWGNRTEFGSVLSNHQIDSFDSTVNLFNSIIEGGSPTQSGGTGNSAVDPLLVDPAGPDGLLGTEDDNVRLSALSPAVDAGDPSLLPADITDLDNDGDTTEKLPFDLDGEPRVIGSKVDIGAYEGGRPTFLLQGAPVQIQEGETATLSVALTTPPTTSVPVQVTLVADDRRIVLLSHDAVSPESTPGQTLVFDATNYDQPQTVTVAARHDRDLLNQTTTIQLAAEGLPLTTVPVTAMDVDPVPSVVFVRADATGSNLGTSWQDALTDLQAAIDIARQRGGVSEVWVAQGRYTPSRRSFEREPRSVTFSLPKGVGFYGGFAGTETSRNERDPERHPTILSGDIQNDDAPGDRNRADNSFSVVMIRDGDAATVLDGFVLRDGNADNPLITQDSFNAYGGGLIVLSGNPTITHCIFEGNRAREGGGVYVRDATPTMDRCIVRRNRSIAGPGLWSVRANMVVTNSVFVGNAASWRGAAVGGSNFATLRNCTVVSNTAAQDGAGATLEVDDGIENCIFWANAMGGVTDEFAQLRTSRATTVNNSDIQGWTRWNQGTGNIAEDPMFVDMLGPDGAIGTADDDLRLQPGSPAINRGAPDFVLSPGETDLDGQPRVRGCVVDMGAYEADVTAGPGDFDGNGRVDLRDFSDFQLCQSLAAENAGLPAGCSCVFDDDKDGQVDLRDFATFYALLVGP